MLTSAVAYSLFTVFGKNVLEQLTATNVLLWRFLIAAPIAWLLVAARRIRGLGPSPFAVRWKPRFALGVLFGFLAWLAFAGLDYLPGALYVVIIYTYPAMVAVGSRLLGKPTSRRVWSAVFLTLVGIGFTVPEVVNGAGESALLGMFLTLGNAFLYACYILYSERIVSDTAGDENAGDGYVATAWGLAGSLAVSAVIVVVAGGFEAPMGAKYVWSMIGLAVISTVVAIVAFFIGVRHLGPAPAALVASTEPVLTLVWVVAFLGESLVPIQIVGAILVIAGVVWSQWTPRSANVI